MVEETIQVIRETEAKAGTIISDADQEYKKILENAHKEAEQLKTDQKDTALKKAEAVMETAHKRGEEIRIKSVADTGNEINLLKEIALKREGEAISLIVSQLV